MRPTGSNHHGLSSVSCSVTRESVSPAPVAPLDGAALFFPYTHVGTVATVTLYLPEPLRTYGGGIAELPMSAGTVQAVLDDLERTRAVLYRNVCDETGAVRRHLNIFVNADNVRDLGGLQTRLKDGDVITIVPAVSGG